MLISKPTQAAPSPIQTIYDAQVLNVRMLQSTWAQIKRSINQAYKRGDEPFANIQTKVLALVFCAYSEALFSKLLHTPNALSITQIEQIKKSGKNNISRAWIKCIQIATSRIDGGKGNHVPNIRKRLGEFVLKYISHPSHVRNKVAHGQWVVALNSDGTAVNNDLTNQLHDLDIVKLERMHHAFMSFVSIMDNIIASPNKAHWMFYWDHITMYENKQQEMANWKLADKISAMNVKYARKKQG